MFSYADIIFFVERAGIQQMECGWQVVIRADIVDPTPQQPHGLDYAIILQDERGYRIFGYDNAHAYDGAGIDDRWDHEHRVGLFGQRLQYEFVSSAILISHFYEALVKYCVAQNVSSDFTVEDDHG